MAITGGTRLRHIHGQSLEELQLMLEALPYKVDIQQIISRANGEWYIHFLIPETAFETPKIESRIESSKPTIKRK